MGSQIVVHSHGPLGYGFVAHSVSGFDALEAAVLEVTGRPMARMLENGEVPIPGVHEVAVPLLGAADMVRALRAAGHTVSYTPGTEPIKAGPVLVH